MKKKYYILILFLLIAHFWGVKPFGYLFLYPSLPVILELLWLLYGVLKYGGKEGVLKKKYLVGFYWLFFGFFLAFLSCYVNYGQGLMQSIITSRRIFFFLAIPALLAIKPKPKEIISAINIYSVWFLFLALVKTYVTQDLFLQVYRSSDFLANQLSELQAGTTDIYLVGLGGGVSLFLISLYYYCDRLTKKFSLNSLYMIFFFLTILFLIQNRSSLFVAVLIVIYTFLKIKSKYKFFIIACFCSSALYFIYSTLPNWINLYNETLSQVNNLDYNRTRSLIYFLTEASPNLFSAIFGNGMLSFHISTSKDFLASIGIFNSDVGFVGFWNEYGIIPIIVFLSLCFKTLTSSQIPFYVKAIAFQILANSLTTAYFGHEEGIITVVLLYYLFVYYRSLKKHIFVK